MINEEICLNLEFWDTYLSELEKDEIEGGKTEELLKEGLTNSTSCSKEMGADDSILARCLKRYVFEGATLAGHGKSR